MPDRASVCLMAEIVRVREISPVEPVRVHLNQIEAIDPRLNAFTEMFAGTAERSVRETAVAQTRHPPELRRGGPGTVKDSSGMAGELTLCRNRSGTGKRARIEDLAPPDREEFLLEVAVRLEKAWSPSSLFRSQNAA